MVARANKMVWPVLKDTVRKGYFKRKDVIIKFSEAKKNNVNQLLQKNELEMMLCKKNLWNILSIRKASEKNRSLDLKFKSAFRE